MCRIGFVSLFFAFSVSFVDKLPYDEKSQQKALRKSFFLKNFSSRAI